MRLGAVRHSPNSQPAFFRLSAALLIVLGDLRRRLGQFDFRVHFVDLRVLRFQSFVDCREGSFQSLHLLMLFYELVEQHHVDRFVADTVRLAIIIASQAAAALR